MTWQELANTLRIGQSIRFSHCAERSGKAYKNAHGIGFSCYRCTDKGFEAFGPRSVADVLASRQALDDISDGNVPAGATLLTDEGVDPKARLWCLGVGLRPEVAQGTYGFRWHEKTRRIFIPVAPNTILARAVDKEDRPKYKLFGRLQEHLYMLSGSPPLVLVEDVLSAIKVNMAGYSSGAILGTSISAEIASRIAGERGPVLLWLDPDAAGMKGRAAVRKALGLYPIEVRYVKTDYKVDPKYLNKEQIKATIEDNMKSGG